MADQSQPVPQTGQQRQIQIKITDEVMKGIHANAMSVAHTPEEFIIDFMTIIPHQRAGMVSARVITSPGHLKRIIAALEDNLKKYEASHGKVTTADAPGGEIGFQSA